MRNGLGLPLRGPRKRSYGNKEIYYHAEYRDGARAKGHVFATHLAVGVAQFRDLAAFISSIASHAETHDFSDR